MKELVSAAALRGLVAVMFVWAFGSVAGAQTLPAPWVAEDIGGPVLSGSTTSSSSTFSIDAAGNDISGSSDQFHFLYQAITGDVEIVTRIDGLSPVNPWTVAGVMVRASLDANSAHAFAAVTPSRGLYFRSRVSAGATTSQLTGAVLTPPVWLRLVRQGSLVEGFASADGSVWTSVGSASIAVGSTAYVGVAVTSRHSRTRTTAVASNIMVRSIGLPAGLQSLDIGSPAVPGDVLAASGSYTITAAGSGIAGTADQFHLVYQPVTGNAEVIARVASIDSTVSWAKAGVTIRESLAAESRHATVAVSRGHGYAVQRRLEPASDTLLTPADAGTAPGWVRLVRTGDLFEAYRSADGSTWIKVAAEMIQMGETVYVGLAATSHSVTVPSTSAIDSLSISSTPATINRPPAVSVVSPAAGAQFTAPATMTISALASDPENRMLSVDFLADSTLISRVTTAPYSAEWTAPGAGTYLLTAVAHDADGGSTTSSAVTVTVQPPANKLPVVSLSTGGTTFAAPASINLSATASDPDGHIARVEFFAGTTLLNTDATAPYAFTWSGVAAGSYSVTAVAYDNEGASASSAPVAITVQPAPNQAPVVSLATDGTTFTAPASIALTATASDPDGQVARVEFFAGTTQLNTDTTAPYAFTWTDVAAGSYSLTALVYDNAGASAASAPIAVTVTAPASGAVQPITAGLVMHLTSEAGVVTTGGNVVRWEDQTANGNTLTAAGAPTLLASAVNGRSAVRFDGIDDALARTGTAGLPSGSGDRSVFMVVRYNAANASTGGWAGFSYGSASTNQTFGVALAPTGTLGVQGWGSSNDISSNPATAGVGRWLVQGAIYGNRVLIQYDTAAHIGSATHTFNTGTGGIRLGEELNGQKNLNMDVAEVLVYNRALTLAEQEHLATYFEARYALAASVGNTPPMISLSTSGTTFTAPATINLTATASDPDGTIARVEFFAGTTRLNTDTAAPYAFTWSGVAAGSYSLTAVAYDNSGAGASSAPVLVTVQAPANKPPVVSLSTGGTTFTAPAAINLSATASDPDGTIARVEFFAGATRLNTDTAAPYAFAWSGMAAGSYSLTAVAYDNSGASATSAPVLVTVNPAVTTTSPKSVAFTASSDHATNVTKYVLKVYASTANPATATPLATSDLGKPTPSTTGEITVDRATFFSNLAPGSYLAVVTAVGPGGETMSASVAFTR